VSSVFGRTGAVVATSGDYDDGEITAAASATNYTPTASTVEGHLAGIDTALGSVPSAYTDADAIAAVEGEATLDLTGDLTVDTNTLVVDSDKVGINEASPDYDLHVHSEDANWSVKFEHSQGQTLFNSFGHIQIQNDNTTPTNGETLDNPLWQIGQRDGGQLDIAFGDLSNMLVPATKAILSLSRQTVTDQNSAPQIGFFGSSPAGKTAVSSLGVQTINADAPTNPTAAELGSTQAAISAVQAKLDALIASLSNLGLV
jgi:hypothetical protein